MYQLNYQVIVRCQKCGSCKIKHTFVAFYYYLFKVYVQTLKRHSQDERMHWVEIQYWIMVWVHGALDILHMKRMHESRLRIILADSRYFFVYWSNVACHRAVWMLCCRVFLSGQRGPHGWIRVKGGFRVKKINGWAKPSCPVPWWMLACRDLWLLVSTWHTYSTYFYVFVLICVIATEKRILPFLSTFSCIKYNLLRLLMYLL